MSKPKTKRRRKNTLSWRQRAGLTLSQLYRLAAVHRDAGEILQSGPWLKVLANVLSSFPEHYDGDRKARNAPEFFGLSTATLWDAARRCGLDASTKEIAMQVTQTKAWRAQESKRLGRPHYVTMDMDTIGELLRVTEITRREAEAWNIGTCGGSPKARAEAAKERDRLRDERRRLAAGARPQAESLSQTKPWEREGISRRTWERRRAKGQLHIDATSSVAISSGPNKEPDAISSGPNILTAGERPCENTLTPNVRDWPEIVDSRQEFEGRGPYRPAPTPDPAVVAEHNELRSPKPLPGGIAERALALVRKPNLAIARPARDFRAWTDLKATHHSIPWRDKLKENRHEAL